jgi:Cytochrome c oxidase subunit IV
VSDPPAAPPVPRGLPAESTLFFGLAGFTAVIGAIYGVATTLTAGFEAAGTLALFGVSAFAAFFGTFLLVMVGRIQDDVEALEEGHAAGDPAADQVLYLPTRSIWPLGLGVGLSLILAGVALGFWVMIPGIALFVHCLIGFAQQSRTRS